MRRIILLTISFITIASAAWGCIWQVGDLYLLGSVHMLRASDYPLDAKIEAAYQASERIVFEIDLASLGGSQIQQLQLKLARQPEGETLQASLSDETYKLLTVRAAELGLPLDRLQLFRAWFVATMLVQLELRKEGYDPAWGLDSYLDKRARQDGKRIQGLESYTDQLEALAGLSRADQELFLKQTITHLDMLDVERMVDGWRQGDSRAMEQILLQSFSSYPAVYDSLITRRNARWLPQIEKLIGSKQKVLVVVGTGHLVGPDGIVNQLKAKGYAVRQL